MLSLPVSLRNLRCPCGAHHVLPRSQHCLLCFFGFERGLQRAFCCRLVSVDVRRRDRSNTSVRCEADCTIQSPAVVCSFCQGLHCPALFHQSYHWHSSRLAAFQQLLILFVSLNTVTTDKLLYSEVPKYLKISVMMVVGIVGFKSRHLLIY